MTTTVDIGQLSALIRSYLTSDDVLAAMASQDDGWGEYGAGGDGNIMAGSGVIRQIADFLGLGDEYDYYFGEQDMPDIVVNFDLSTDTNHTSNPYYRHVQYGNQYDMFIWDNWSLSWESMGTFINGNSENATLITGHPDISVGLGYNDFEITPSESNNSVQYWVQIPSPLGDLDF